MQQTVELNEKKSAVSFLVDGLWLQRLANSPQPGLSSVLELALEITSSGQPLLPLGFLADFRSIAVGAERLQISRETLPIPDWAKVAGQLQKYEDHVLGKFMTDWTVERASDAMKSYQGRDLTRGLTYLFKQFRERSQLGGVEISPAILRDLMQLNPRELLQESYDRIESSGISTDILDWYQPIVESVRRSAEIFTNDDLFDVESRIALADLGELVAMNQIKECRTRIIEELPIRPLPPLEGRKEIPSRVLDEDQYPVGGYSSISNRGTMESLLHSQLAFMEPADRPDLFDIKYLRNELFYYSRDENQFRRKRRAFLIVCEPSLIQSRYQDIESRYQRIVMVQSYVIAIVEKLIDWLSEDALQILIALPRDRSFPVALQEEKQLFELLLSHHRSSGIVEIVTPGVQDADPETQTSTRSPGPVRKGAQVISDAQKNAEWLSGQCQELRRNSQVYVMVIGVNPETADEEGVVASTLQVNGPRPILRDGFGIPVSIEADDSFEYWIELTRHTLQLWV